MEPPGSMRLTTKDFWDGLEPIFTMPSLSAGGATTAILGGGNTSCGDSGDTSLPPRHSLGWMESW